MIDDNDDRDDELFRHMVDWSKCIGVTSSHCQKPRQEDDRIQTEIKSASKDVLGSNLNSGLLVI